jgi:hypothetical protein
VATLHGRNGKLYLAASASAAAIAVTEATEWQLQTQRDLAEDNAFGDSWKTNLAGLQGWSASANANLDTAQSTLFSASTASGAVRMYLYPDIATPTSYYYGTGWVNMNVTTPLGGKTAASISVTGDGQIAVNG